MTREELLPKVLADTSAHYLFELATGYGKTRLALEKIASWYKPGEAKVLIAIPKLTIIDTSWKSEIAQWHFEEYLPDITFTTYVSLPKHAGKAWDVVVLDEAHHLTERCREAFNKSTVRLNHLMALSATLNKQVMWWLRSNCRNLATYRIDLQTAIEDEVLAEPQLVFIPLELDKLHATEVIVRKAKKNSNVAPVTTTFANRFKYRSYGGEVRISCTPFQYCLDLNQTIEWAKNVGNQVLLRNKCIERLKWLATAKHDAIETLLKKLSYHRTLLFCPSIEETDKFRYPCIHSKNKKEGKEALERFNAKKTKHLSAVGMLDEGCNLAECKVGVFQMINSGERLTIQRLGRTMRHKSPVIVFPYYVGTREEEIVKKLQSEYKPQFVKTVKLKEFSL